MKNTYVIALLAVTTATLLSGCATKRYGRLQPLTSYESRNYNCTQIDLELAKIDAFEQQVAEQAKFSGMSVASFLGISASATPSNGIRRSKQPKNAVPNS